MASPGKASPRPAATAAETDYRFQVRRWPLRRSEPARILRRTTIQGTGALVLLAPAYPDGGLMGGHIIVLWNRGHHGYLLSLHFDSSNTGRTYTQSERVSSLALAIAATFAPTGG